MPRKQNIPNVGCGSGSVLHADIGFEPLSVCRLCGFPLLLLKVRWTVHYTPAEAVYASVLMCVIPIIKGPGRDLPLTCWHGLWGVEINTILLQICATRSTQIDVGKWEYMLCVHTLFLNVDSFPVCVSYKCRCVLWPLLHVLKIDMQTILGGKEK